MTSQTGASHGTNEPFGSRESSWDTSDRNELIALHWEAIKRAHTETTFDRDAIFFGSFGHLAEFLGSLAVGATFAGPAGVCIVLGAHAADAVGLDEELAVGGLPGPLRHRRRAARVRPQRDHPRDRRQRRGRAPASSWRSSTGR